MLVEPETGGNTVYLREGQTESSPAAPPGPGSVPLRLGHYLLTEELARGGAAIVYRGHDPALHRQVAVKILQAGPLASREAVRRLFLEARATARLHHRHILPVYEVGGAESQPYIVMPLLEGDTLAARIRDGDYRSTTPADLARLFLKITAAVQHAHYPGPRPCVRIRRRR